MMLYSLGLPIKAPNTALGVSLPAKPHFKKPVPLSKTTTELFTSILKKESEKCKNLIII